MRDEIRNLELLANKSTAVTMKETKPIRSKVTSGAKESENWKVVNEYTTNPVVETLTKTYTSPYKSSAEYVLTNASPPKPTTTYTTYASNTIPLKETPLRGSPLKSTAEFAQPNKFRNPDLERATSALQAEFDELLKTNSPYRSPRKDSPARVYVSSLSTAEGAPAYVTTDAGVAAVLTDVRFLDKPKKHESPTRRLIQ